jgi:hypothetical protein
MCSTHERDEKFIQSLLKKAEWKKQLGGTWHRREDNIKLDFKKNGYEDVCWLKLRVF